MSLPTVSRETNEALEHFSTLVRKWTPRINLVSRASLGAIRERHIEDSAQLHALARHPVRHWADLGSGGGFPGIVVAILARQTGSPEHVTLVESDKRKSAFLTTAIRELHLRATVRAERIEAVEPLSAEVVSARALAHLDTLLGFAARHMAPDGEALFPKGASWEKELREAQSKWQFDWQVDKSRTEPGSVILRVTGVPLA